MEAWKHDDEAYVLVLDRLELEFLIELNRLVKDTESAPVDTYALFNKLSTMAESSDLPDEYTFTDYDPSSNRLICRFMFQKKV